MVRRSRVVLSIALLGVLPFLFAQGEAGKPKHKVYKPSKSDCPTFCTAIYDPVCAAGCRRTSLTTFGNLCEAKRYACQNCETIIWYKGTCPCK